MHTQTRRRCGRPRLDRERILLNPVLDERLAAELHRQARAAGVQVGPYVELVLARFFGHESPYLPAPGAPLPVRVASPSELHDRIARIDRLCCLHEGGSRRVPVRVDPPLAAAIRRRAEELGVGPGPYVRAVMRVMAGYERPSLDHEWTAPRVDGRRCAQPADAC